MRRRRQNPGEPARETSGAYEGTGAPGTGPPPGVAGGPRQQAGAQQQSAYPPPPAVAPGAGPQSAGGPGPGPTHDPAQVPGNNPANGPGYAPANGPGSTAAPGAKRAHGSRRAAQATPTGLTAPGAFVVAFGLTMLGMLLDELFTDMLGKLFATVFIGSCVLVAARTRPRDLVAAAFAPPLAFALTILLHSLLFPTENVESFLVRTALDMFQGLAYKAGVVWSGSMLAVAIVLVRYRADQQATRRRAGREAGQTRDGRGGRDFRDTRETRAPRPAQRDPRDPREARDLRDPRDTRDPQAGAPGWGGGVQRPAPRENPRER